MSMPTLRPAEITSRVADLRLRILQLRRFL